MFEGGLPPCAGEDCKNDGMILLGNKFYCGECVGKIQQKKQSAV